ncbi:hypothetical protein ABT297_11795 [Dactylosporangium sp. NPDC000555]|uniref:hypothetical protein n=1 Tax=Dactylosporangium sp. NPDC000555 TaxID=3154260 RepID=UPI0033200828
MLSLVPGSAERRAIDLVARLGLPSLRRTLVLVVAALCVVTAIVVAAATWTAPRGSDPAAVGGPGGPAAPSGPPVAAVSSVAGVSCRSGWVVPDHGAAPIPYLPDRAPDGGVATGGAEAVVTVQGLTGRAVVLQSMTVEVVRRRPPLAGVYLPLGCQGGVSPRKYRLDLDAAAPRIVPETGTVTFPYRVDQLEPEQFLITPDVTTGDVEWRLLLSWTSGADRGTLVLPEAGKPPFRNTATTAARELCADLAAWAWKPSC